MITILNYGEGNITSVQKAFEHLGQHVVVSSSIDDIKTADALVIPGQGAFKQVMSTLKAQNFISPIKDYITAQKPFLGICLGFQILFEGSEEHGGCEGLGIYPGSFKQFKSDSLKVPQMGWNKIQASEHTYMYKGIQSDEYVYFVHSYYLPSTNKAIISSKTEYGLTYVSAIEDGAIWGTQFHPEKSGDIGLNILKNFIKLI